MKESGIGDVIPPITRYGPSSLLLLRSANLTLAVHSRRLLCRESLPLAFPHLSPLSMADFGDWYDAAGGADDPDADSGKFSPEEDYGVLGLSAPSAARDAVLFLVDCSLSMFQSIPGTSSASSESTPEAPFAQVMQAIMSFYQAKIVTSDKDYMGLVMYNTRAAMNRYDFPNIYTFHEMDCPGAPRVQELEVLSLAATPTSDVHKQFVQLIGHMGVTVGDPARVETKYNIAMERELPNGAALSMKHQSSLPDALWAAQHMFHHLPSKNVAYKRIFIFTDSAEPCTGVARERCFARRKDLHEAGVVIEVFAHGNDVVSAATTQGSAAQASSSPPAAASLPLFGAPHLTPPARASGVPRTFDRGLFWDSFISLPLQKSLALGGQLAPSSVHSSGSSASLFDEGGEYCGGVSVSTHSTFEGLLSNVRLRTYPQRVAGRLPVRIGTSPDAPRFAATVFIPVMRCPKPKFSWLESSTNGIVTTETRLLSKATGGEVTSSELLFSTTVGGAQVTFRREEVETMRRRVKMLVGEKKGPASGPAGGPATVEPSTTGITILCFKSRSEALRLKHCVSRSSFLHVDRNDGGPHALKLFVQLHRTLTEQAKVAVAEMSVRGPSRLVLLVPSISEKSCVGGYDPTDDAVVGCGFHIFYLPYADDIRSLQFPPPPPVSEAALSAARKTIRRLSVDYDALAITNPALQCRYHLLQRLALMDPNKSVAPVDVTLPDTEGMAKYADVFAEFNKAVFPAGYSAEQVCPPAKHPPPPPSDDQMAAVDFDQLEKDNKLATLTVPYLRRFLAMHKVDGHGASLKQDLVAMVAEIVRKRRGQVKRERSE
jgi:hypothetical protein